MTGVSPDDPDRLVAAFAAAVDHAIAIRPSIRPDWRDPFEHAAKLADALGPYDTALDAYTLVVGEGWSEDDFDAVRDARELAGHKLRGLLELRDQAPRILGERLVAIERDGGVLFQEQPGDGPAPAGGGAAAAPADCCFTRIKFKNLLNQRIRVTARHRDGAAVTQEFAGDEEHTLFWGKVVAEAVPGALGHCVDLELQVKEGNGWGEVLRLRLCCEHDAHGGVTPRRGDKLTLEGEAPPPPPADGHVHTVARPARVQALEITEVVCADPCPETASGDAGNANAGEASSGISKLPGARISDDYYHYGAWTRIRFKPKPGGCRDFCFVQGVKRKAWFKGGPGGQFRLRPMMCSKGDGDVFLLDIWKGDQTPCYPVTSDIAGGKEMRDFPGVKNPFGRVEIAEEGLGKLQVGGTLKVQWTFRTWVVCTNPAPASVLGYFDWGFTVEIVIGKDAAATRVTFDPDPLRQPIWSDQKDLDTYKKVARQAPNSNGYIPP